MNAILGMTDLALDTRLSDEQRNYLTVVNSSANALLNVINDLLDFSKIEAGKLDLDQAPFGLRAALNETLRALALRAHKKGLELLCHLDPDVPDALVGDAGRLRQVLLNLVGNAIKFTEQGEVLVEVKIADCRLPTADSQKDNLQSAICNLQFSVKDTGIGIPPDKQGTIFQAFEQGDNSTTRRYGGTGLGLSIASRLVGLMGGQIAVESAPDRGSTFRFTARFGVQPPAPGAGPASPPVEISGLRVLVVDDNATNRLILQGWLRGWRTEPTAVADGLTALNALWRGVALGRPYGVVLLDSRMPGVGGLALAAEISQSPELAGCRVILLTSEDRPANLARQRASGIAAVAMKPIQQEELLDTIYRVLSRPAEGDREGGRPDDCAAEDGWEPPPPPPPERSLRVLLAEDNEFNQQVVQHILARLGHTVQVAKDGREALAALRDGEFDLLLLDMHMPEIDGFRVIEAVRRGEQATGRHLPVIALTARSTSGDRERCLRAGMDEYLSKPIRRPELFAAIERVLAGRPTAEPVPAGAAPAEALFDPATLLTACDGDPALLARMVAVFRASAPAQLGAVAEAIRNADAAALGESAHKLRGLVSAFSTTAAAVARRLEETAAAGQLDGAVGHHAALADMIRDLGPLLANLSIGDLKSRPQ
jgi:CheY-like chemotaxis protein/HPt (histidine-containing phosphotransfer) domain-containing protein